MSACSGDCLDSYAPFSPPYVSPVSFLLPQDITTFIRGDGTTQLAYKGAPLYRAAADVRSGTMNGVSPDGWALAVP